MTEQVAAMVEQSLDFSCLRMVDLSKPLDPATGKRRCVLRRHPTWVGGVHAYHTHIDITSHLGTHLEFPGHWKDEWKDGMKLPIESFLGRGVLLNLATARPRELIRAEDLEAASGGRVRAGDTILLDSPFHSEPFVESPDDRRPDMSGEAAQWFLEKGVKGVGFGDGIAIENHAEGCVACHEILLGHDILLLEVLVNLDRLRQDVFLIIYTPLPIVGLDSCPVRVVAVEGLPGLQ